MLPIVVFVIVLLPIAWLASEFQDRRWIRITAGCAALLSVGGVAFAVGSLERLNSYSWFGDVTKDFVDGTIVGLEAGRHPQVLDALRKMQAEYNPTYENRARYDELVQAYLRSLKTPVDAMTESPDEAL
ncbi:MAG TPA: hypothetical protein VM165_09710 [Planctomycetaceae bacterium]|nr:hypothetical protein [Planctomycetaceae bacterium]